MSAVTPVPRLSVDEPRSPRVRAIALVLHGGRSASTAPVRGRQLAVLRMLPFTSSLSRTGSSQGLAVARLRFAVRGWNGAECSPVADAAWAIEQLTTRFPGVPIALIGHSMGGRTALYAAGAGAVSAVVALAPWVEAGDPADQLAGRRVLIVHGENDRMTSARRSAAYALRAEQAGATVTYVRMREENHAMLRRARLWHELTTGFALGVLLGTAPPETVGAEATNVLTEALAGERTVVV
ncbi:MAG: hypothetical protein QOE97_777 [Pseudonocardiales bacterium]|nr:hypothetical protein [Pseudonocardiales bacterium]